MMTSGSVRLVQRVRPLAPALIAFGLALAFLWPAFDQPHRTGFGDWQMIHHNWEAGYVAITRHGEWPLWDPYHCGGVTIWGNPESQHFSPFFPLSLLIGTTLALKLMLLVHAWTAILGMYLLARREYALGAPAAWLAAIAWSTSGFFAWQLGGGHVTFVSFYLAPWVLLAFRRAVEDPRWSAAVALLLALTVYQGGTYPFPYFVLLLAFDGTVQLFRPDRRRKVLVAAGATAVLTALTGAIRFIPIVETLRRLPRTVASQDRMLPWEVLEMLTTREHEWSYPGHEFVWPEYSNYVGWGIVLAALAGLAVVSRRRQFHLIAGLVLFGAFMLGHLTDWMPWALAHRLPVYDSLRVPSRFTVLFSLYLVLIAASAVDAVDQKLGERTARHPAARMKVAVPWALLALFLVEPFLHNRSTAALWTMPPIDRSSVADRFHFVPGHGYHHIYASLPHRHQGTPACYVGNMNWQVSPALWVGPAPQVRIYGTPGRALDGDRTSNRAWAEVELEAPGRVVVNQNWDPDWTVSVGNPLEDRGRLAADLPAGRHRILARYAPGSLPGSFALTGGGWLALACTFLLARTRRTPRPRR